MTNKHNTDSYKNKSLRKIGYDYSKAGLYFVTICSQNQICLFGKIEKGKMFLNEAGKMVEYWYYKLESKFPDVKCYDRVIMPNHFHCVIEIKELIHQQHRSSLIEIVQWFKTMTTNE